MVGIGYIGYRKKYLNLLTNYIYLSILFHYEYLNFRNFFILNIDFR